MFQPRSIQSSLSIREKILSLDFILVFSILILGLMSMFAMYSTDGGEFKYHTKSHIIRFCVFFTMFLILSFFPNKVLVQDKHIVLYYNIFTFIGR